MTTLFDMSIIKKCKLKYASVAEWQTRTFKGRVRKSVGSSPTTRTNIASRSGLFFSAIPPQCQWFWECWKFGCGALRKPCGLPFRSAERKKTANAFAVRCFAKPRNHLYYKAPPCYLPKSLCIPLQSHPRYILGVARYFCARAGRKKKPAPEGAGLQMPP